jgi:DNA-binding transcriptional MocR family regulator
LRQENVFHSDAWTPFFRFNTSWAWGEREEQAVIQLGKLISTMLNNLFPLI